MKLSSLIRRFKQDSTESRVREAVEAGIGVYNRSWELGDEPSWLEDAFDAAVLEWCRDTMAQMRRPYGLDYVTLTVALLDEENNEVARLGFGVLRPGDFYLDGSVPGRLAQLIREWREEGQFDSSRCLSAVMFSWGDLTRELLVAG